MNTKQNQHTPGPWHVMPDGDGLPLTIDSDVHYVAEAKYKPAGGYRLNGDVYLETAKANARLIAAAPDLLDVVKRYVANIPEADQFAHDTGECPATGDDTSECLLCAARAALNKAGVQS